MITRNIKRYTDLRRVQGVLILATPVDDDKTKLVVCDLSASCGDIELGMESVINHIRSIDNSSDFIESGNMEFRLSLLQAEAQVSEHTVMNSSLVEGLPARERYKPWGKLRYFFHRVVLLRRLATLELRNARLERDHDLIEKINRVRGENVLLSFYGNPDGSLNFVQYTKQDFINEGKRAVMDTVRESLANL